MTREALYAVLAGERVGVISTVSPDGRPQSALVGLVVTPAFEIVFETLDASRKYRNLVANPAAAFAIGGPGPVSVQYEGEARIAAGPERREYHERYLERWPEARDRQHWPGLTCFVARPTWIRYTDARLAPHGQVEFTFPAD